MSRYSRIGNCPARTPDPATIVLPKPNDKDACGITLRQPLSNYRTRTGKRLCSPETAISLLKAWALKAGPGGAPPSIDPLAFDPIALMPM